MNPLGGWRTPADVDGVTRPFGLRTVASVALGLWSVAAVGVPLLFGPSAAAASGAAGIIAASVLFVFAFRSGAPIGRSFQRGTAVLVVGGIAFSGALFFEAGGVGPNDARVASCALLGWTLFVIGFQFYRRLLLARHVEQWRRRPEPVAMETVMVGAAAVLLIWQICVVPFGRAAGWEVLLLAMVSPTLGVLNALLGPLQLAVIAGRHVLLRSGLVANVVTICVDVTVNAVILSGEPVDHRLFYGGYAIGSLILARAICDAEGWRRSDDRCGSSFLGSVQVWVMVGSLAVLPVVAIVRAASSTTLEPWGFAIASTIITAGVARRLRVSMRRADEVHDSLTEQARLDPLTGLPNRRGLVDHVQALPQTLDVPTSVLFVDLDGFKSVNDNHGHATGDRLLQLVAERIRQEVRRADVIARLGGDEFVVIGCYHRNDAALLGNRLIGALQQPFDIDGMTVEIGASIGLAQAGPSEPIGQALSRADAAMYNAKAGGKGHVVLAPR